MRSSYVSLHLHGRRMYLVALISELVTELSVMSGIAEPSVAVVARHLREAGLISQKGRGRGAAHATALDAARLCIALMIGGKAKDGPEVVRDFGQLRSRIAHFEPGRPFSVFNLEETCGLGDGHAFEDAFAGLIGVWAREDIVERMNELSGPSGLLPGMLARLHDHTLTGEIFFGMTHYCYDHDALRKAVELPDEDDPVVLSEKRFRLESDYFSVSGKYASGIRSSREISGVEIQPLGEVVAGLRPAGYRESTAEMLELWRRSWSRTRERSSRTSEDSLSR